MTCHFDSPVFPMMLFIGKQEVALKLVIQPNNYHLLLIILYSTTFTMGLDTSICGRFKDIPLQTEFKTAVYKYIKH